MGAWGTAIFSNDTSSDVRAEFRDLIADGVGPREATDRLVSSYEPGSGEDAVDFWLGLALAQHRLGRLLPDVHQAAVAAAQQEDLSRWQREDRDKRRQAVAKALAELASEQPPSKAARKQPKSRTDLVEGQHFLYSFAPGRQVLFQVRFVQDGCPLIAMLDWRDNDPVPEGEALLGLQAATSADGEAVRFLAYGAKDPVSRMTLLPERLPPRHPVKRHWWSRPSVPYEAPKAFVVSWRSLPKWFDENGRVRHPHDE